MTTNSNIIEKYRTLLSGVYFSLYVISWCETMSFRETFSMESREFFMRVRLAIGTILGRFPLFLTFGFFGIESLKPRQDPVALLRTLAESSSRAYHVSSS